MPVSEIYSDSRTRHLIAITEATPVQITAIRIPKEIAMSSRKRMTPPWTAGYTAEMKARLTTPTAAMLKLRNPSARTGEKSFSMNRTSVSGAARLGVIEKILERTSAMITFRSRLLRTVGGCGGSTD